MISSVPGSISFVVISVGSIVSCVMITSLFINYNPIGFNFNSIVSEQGQAIAQHDLFSFVVGAPALAPAFAQSLSFDDLQGVESAANSSVSRHPYDISEQGQAIAQHDLFSFVAGAPALALAFAQSLSFDDLQGVESAANSSVSRHPYDSKETDAWSFICSV
ncbi:uncharacterized protein A4U43_C09F11330 [Asparagus officinalis]|uniref:Uncharacterized protein n=1 Tax=Asparagus officinalis TaxID=4686 RepID=A0A5P1E8M5_ASPOF|nr:uncharacterized protein A4U43_C09F11330 [Asparagus officinalis]